MIADSEGAIVMTELIRDTVEVVLGGTHTGLHPETAGRLGPRV